MDCHEVRWLLTASLHAELDAEAARQLESHIAACESCRRTLAFEQAFEARLRAVPSSAAPEALRASLRSRLRALRRRSRLRTLARPAVWIASGALAACLLIASTLLLHQPRNGPGELIGTVVCLGCTLRPETIPFHSRHREYDHVNGLRDRSGQLWHLADTAEHHSWAVDDGLLKQEVRVRGMLFPQSRAVYVESLERVEDSPSARSLRSSSLPEPAGVRGSDLLSVEASAALVQPAGWSLSNGIPR